MPFNPATARPIFDPSTARPVNDQRKKIVDYGDSGAQIEFPANMPDAEIAAILRRDKPKIEAVISRKRAAQKTTAPRRQSGTFDPSSARPVRPSTAFPQGMFETITPQDGDNVVDYLDYFGSRR